MEGFWREEPSNVTITIRWARQRRVDTHSLAIPFLSRFAPVLGLVTLWQTLACRCQNYGLQSSRGERDRLGFSRLGNHLEVPVMPHHIPTYGATHNAHLRAISTAVLTASSGLSV